MNNLRGLKDVDVDREEYSDDTAVTLGNGSCNEPGLGGGHNVDQILLSTTQPGVSGSELGHEVISREDVLLQLQDIRIRELELA